MSKTNFFYTAKEIKELKEIIRTGEPILQIAERLCEQYGTSRVALAGKLYKIAKHTTKVREWNGPKRKTIAKKQTVPLRSEGIELSEGVILDFTNVKRAILNPNKSITIYF